MTSFTKWLIMSTTLSILAILDGTSCTVSNATTLPTTEASATWASKAISNNTASHSSRTTHGATSTATTKTLTFTVKHQTYFLTVSHMDDVKSFRYAVVRHGIVWIEPLPLKNGLSGIYKGKYWSIYFTPFESQQHQAINLKRDARLQARLPVRQNTFYNSISKVGATHNDVLIEVAQEQKGAGSNFEALYLNENSAKPRLTQLIHSYEYDAGGVFGETLLSDGYFILVQKMPKNSGAQDAMWVRVRAFHFSDHKWFTVHSDINAKHDYTLPTLNIRNGRLYYFYSKTDDTSVKLPS